MEKINLWKHQPSCMLAHEIINKLAVIAGHCDPVTERVPGEAKHARRLGTIREVDKGIAGTLREHQCEFEITMRETISKRPAKPAPRGHARRKPVQPMYDPGCDSARSVLK
jgi:hypothetical protein